MIVGVSIIKPLIIFPSKICFTSEVSTPFYINAYLMKRHNGSLMTAIVMLVVAIC
jgi:hypothetical protein